MSNFKMFLRQAFLDWKRSPSRVPVHLPVHLSSSVTTHWQQPFLINNKKLFKRIRAWQQYKINGHPIGKRRFCQILASWRILDDGQIHIDMKFDRQAKFMATRKGKHRVDIYDRPRDGNVIMVVQPRVERVWKGDTLLLS